jgi:hypothetical protein
MVKKKILCDGLANHSETRLITTALVLFSGLNAGAPARFLMTRFINFTTAVLLLSFFSPPNALSANPVGQVVDVIQNATVARAGQQASIQQGQTIVLGDVITTGATGRVQLLFQDDTKIAMSANSRLVIDSILFESPDKASEFAVTAMGGAFRFLSGNSETSVYSVSTPDGTMETQGAVFDFSVVPQRAVSAVTFRGEVELCNRSNRCARLGGGCAVVQLNSSGGFVVPETPAEKTALLSRGFPYITHQNDLLRVFRTRTSTCPIQALQIQTLQIQALQSLGSGAGSPSQPSATQSLGRNPKTGGAQTGNNTSAGLGGSTADGVSAGAGGPSAPGDANAGPGGASAGGAGAGASAGGASAGGGQASAGGN